MKEEMVDEISKAMIDALEKAVADESNGVDFNYLDMMVITSLTLTVMEKFLKPPKVVVEISNGEISNMYSTKEISVCTVDHDKEPKESMSEFQPAIIRDESEFACYQSGLSGEHSGK